MERCARDYIARELKTYKDSCYEEIIANFQLRKNILTEIRNNYESFFVRDNHVFASFVNAKKINDTFLSYPEKDIASTIIHYLTKEGIDEVIKYIEFALTTEDHKLIPGMNPLKYSKENGILGMNFTGPMSKWTRDMIMCQIRGLQTCTSSEEYRYEQVSIMWDKMFKKDTKKQHYGYDYHYDIVTRINEILWRNFCIQVDIGNLYEALGDPISFYEKYVMPYENHLLNDIWY